MTTTLWLIRHPEPEASSDGRCYGSLDWSLSPNGLRQAHAIAQVLAAEPVATIYSSPRRRCVQAAGILAAGRSCPLEICEGLRELDFGEFEGRRYEEIAALHPELYRQWMESPTEVQFPAGESFPAMRERVLAAAGGIRKRHTGETVALVTHGGAIRIMVADALGLDAAHIFRLGQRHAALNLIRYFGETPLVEMVNGTPAGLC
jgi:alpha-ribazole phosphatase/probable phosphoglycerate mutase